MKYGREIDDRSDSNDTNTSSEGSDTSKSFDNPADADISDTADTPEAIEHSDARMVAEGADRSDAAEGSGHYAEVTENTDRVSDTERILDAAEDAEYLKESDKNKELEQLKNTEYSNAMRDITERYAGSISEQDRIRLLEKKSMDDVYLYEPGQYVEEFPEFPYNVMGHYDSVEDTIHVKDTGKNEAVRHILTHECMHKASFKDTGYETTESGDLVQVKQSGIRVCGEGINRNMGLNEGVTEMYTLEALKRRNESESARAISSYTDVRIMAKNLSALVGEERIERAYFAGETETLERETDRLAGYAGAYKDFNNHLDAMNRSDSVWAYQKAVLGATKILLTMRRNKNADQ